MRGLSIAAAAVAAAAVLLVVALSDSCEARHVAVLAGPAPADPSACMELAVKIAEFNSSCPMQVPDLDCG